MNFNSKKINYLFLLAITVLISYFLFLLIPTITKAQQINDLQSQIEAQKNKINELQQQQKIYQDKIDQVRKQAVSLKNQITILDNQIAKIKTGIAEKEEQIKETELSIQDLQLKIEDQYKQIDTRKIQLTSLLQLINQNDNKNSLEIILLNGNVSDFLDQAKYLENLQSSLQDNLEKMKLIKEGLEGQKQNLEGQKQTLSNLQQDLISQKNELSTTKLAKTNLLSETRGAEWKFQALLADAVSEQKKAETEIANAEAAIRKKMSEQKQKEMLAKLEEGGGPLVLSWPVPEDVITSSFHDPDYPFKSLIGEHPAVDIRAAYGTAIRAPAAGYVAKVHDGGMGYSYIMLIHRDGISTVYGHVSAIFVNEGDYVQRGNVIGRTGGTPGTPGAGRFCTGPHLHFEVRLNGVPINPLSYLV